MPTYFEKLSDPTIREIAAYLTDDAEALTNLAKAAPIAAAKVAKEVRAVIWRRWEAWLAAAPDPSGMHLPELDIRLRDFALGTAKTFASPKLPANLRLHVHRRAGQLGFTTASRQGPSWQNKRVDITKPLGWRMPWNGAKTYKVVPPQKLSQKAAKAKRQERKERWRTTCDECGEELDAWEALYDLSGLGPLCDDCVNADGELQGRKWEAKADFW